MSVARIGFSELHSGGTEPVADIVFVHGLGGHPERTWTYAAQTTNNSRIRRRLFNFRSDKKTRQPEESIFWPRELLRSDLSNCRILTYGYDSDIVNFMAPVDRSSLYQHSSSFLIDLSHQRQKWPSRPIIFVAHSLGGILVKDTLKQSQDAQYKPKLQSIYEHTYGVIFLGTPHRGSDWATLAKSLTIFALGKMNDKLLRSLQVGSTDLERLTDAFAIMLKENKVKVWSFVESQAMTDIPGFANKIVDDFSSRIGDAAEISQVLHANHRTMCKFAGSTDSNYQKVLAALKELVLEIQDQPPEKSSTDNRPAAAPWIIPGFFANEDYRTWIRSKSHQVLWLSGPFECRIRNAALHLVQSRKQDTNAADAMVLYFFCTPTRLEGHLSMSFVHTILFQILQHSSDSAQSQVASTFIQAALSGYSREKERSKDHQRYADRTDHEAITARLDGVLWEAIKNVLHTQRELQIMFIVDGLDDTLEENFLRALRQFIDHITRQAGVKALVTSTSSPDMKKLLEGLPCIEYDKERKECLAGLRIDDLRYRKIAREHKGSFQWLWTHEQYLNWHNHRESRLLLVVGKPGSGKSTITKFFAQNARELQGDPDVEGASPVVAKFFYSYRDGERQRSHESMFRSILWDIITQEESFFYHGVQTIYRAQQTYGSRAEWDYDSLIQALMSLCGYSTERCFYLIIDAIDESDDHDRHRMVNVLHEICSQATCCTIKAFVASRPVGYLGSKWFDNTIRLQDETTTDIRRYIISFLDGFELTTTLEQAINYIVTTAEGVFIWVQLVGRELQRQVFASEEQIFGFLQKLPTGLEEFYELMLERARHHISHLIKLFQFILFAKRPLVVEEVCHALAVPDQLGDKYVASYKVLERSIPRKSYVTQCGGDFLELQDVDGTEYVQFIHQTAREFLLQPTKSMTASALWANSEISQKQISIVCLRYLALFAYDSMPEHIELWEQDDFHRYAEYLNRLLLAEYAIQYLTHYLAICYEDPDVKAILGELADILCPTIAWCLLDNFATSYLDTSLAKTNRHDMQHAKTFKERTLLACVVGCLPVAVRILLAVGADANHKDESGASLLAKAAPFGYQEIVSILLSQPEILPDVKDADGRTPLSLAAKAGHVSTVRLLLDHRNVDTISNDRNSRTPLSFAAEYGHVSVIEALTYKRREGTMLSDDQDRSPLSWAAIGGHEAAVAALIQAYELRGSSFNDDGHFINSKDSMGRTALSLAAYHGNVNAVRLMLGMESLQQFLDRNSSDIHEMTPLSLSASRGHVDVVSILLSTDKVDITKQNQDGLEVLSVAAASGQGKVVELLIKDPRININLQDCRGWTAIYHAAFHGHDDVLRILVADERAEVDMQDADGLTALWRASFFGHTNTVRTLVSTKRVNPNIKDADGWTALAWTAQENMFLTMQELLSAAEVEIDSADHRGLTPLWWAADRGNEHAVQLLLGTSRASLYTTDAVGQTPLLRAVWRGHKQVVLAILRVDTGSCDIPERWGRTPLSWAVEVGDIHIIKSLLETGMVDMDKKDIWGWTPRSRAEESENDEIFELFRGKEERECTLEQ